MSAIGNCFCPLRLHSLLLTETSLCPLKGPTRRKSELSASRIGREWPYRIAVPADQIMVKPHDIIDEFRRELSLRPRGHTVRGDDVTYSVVVSPMCHAERFCEISAAIASIRRIAVAAGRGSSAARAKPD
jgi:hypothetical protein